MNICVCVKQVPDTNEIRIDPQKHTLIRTGVPSVLNPFDAYALEAAVRLKEEAPVSGRVTVVSMGPAQAEEMLRGCLAVGADSAYLISGRAFGGSDTLATSYILSEAIREVGKREGAAFDLILCGKQAVDGDTAQVGPEIAEHLNLPQITCALNIEDKGECLYIKRENGDGYDIMSVKLPAVVTVSRMPFEARYPTLKSKLAAKKKEIRVLSEEDLETIELERCGLGGSPTRVKSTYVPVREKKGVILKDMPAGEAAKCLVGLITEGEAAKRLGGLPTEGGAEDGLQ